MRYKIKIISAVYTIILTSLLFNACGSTPAKQNTIIQKEITAAVDKYNSDDWEARLSSIKTISMYSGTIYAKNAMLLLIMALDDSHSEVRIASLKVLKDMRAPAAEKKIGLIALSDENSNVRHFAFSALEEYGNIKNEEIFIKGLEDKDWFVKEASLKGLMRITDPGIQIKHLDIIINAINDKNVSIKLTAIANLTIRDPLIYVELSKIVNNEKSGLFILKAALQKIKDYKLDLKTKNRIIALLTHRDKEIRILSLQALKQQKSNIDL